jgi:hypothetical protein
VFPSEGFFMLGKSLTDISIPFTAFILFQPVQFYLVDLFECTETSGDDYGDAYLIRDCEEECWTSVHLSVTILAWICMLVWIPVVLQLRVSWQEYQTDLNVHTLPKF